MKKQLTLKIIIYAIATVMLAGVFLLSTKCAKGQVITDWADTTGNGMDDRFIILSGFAHIIGWHPEYYGTAQAIQSTTQCCFHTNIPLPQTGDWHSVTFKYTASEKVIFSVMVSQYCGICYGVIPASARPRWVHIKYKTATQYKLMWWTLASGYKPSWMTIDDLAIDMPIENIPPADSIAIIYSPHRILWINK